MHDFLLRLFSAADTLMMGKGRISSGDIHAGEVERRSGEWTERGVTPGTLG